MQKPGQTAPVLDVTVSENGERKTSECDAWGNQGRYILGVQPRLQIEYLVYVYEADFTTAAWFSLANSQCFEKRSSNQIWIS